MKTAKSIIVVLFVLLTAQIASAYYCPSTGRWLSRDPIGEPGFRALQMASVAPSRWINRDPIKKGGPSLYQFVGDDSINRIDALGLMTIQDVHRMIALMDQAVRGIKCCCSDTFLANATISGKANGTAVSLTAGLQILSEKCPSGIVTYFWWDCFTAQQEGGYSLFHGNKDAWKDYGWRTGGDTASGTHVGGTGSWFGFDPADSMDWDWSAIVVYVRCNNGHMHVEGKGTGQLQFSWITDANAWGNYPYRP
jgi:hypothetical protein